MSEKYSVFELTELTRLSCVCKCGAEITVQIEPDSEPGFSNKCPACDNSLYTMSDLLKLYESIQTKAKQAGPRVRLCSPPIRHDS